MIGAPLYFIKTGQTGAQTQIDIAPHTSTWALTPTANWSLAGGIFEMKAGSNATASVYLSIYQGVDLNGTLLSTATLSNATFCGQVSNCGSYGPHTFSFAAPIALTASVAYFIALQSTAPDVQSQAYFIKSGNQTIVDEFGNVITNPSAVEVPEPGSVALAAGAMLVLVAGAIRRF